MSWVLTITIMLIYDTEHIHLWLLKAHDTNLLHSHSSYMHIFIAKSCRHISLDNLTECDGSVVRVNSYSTTGSSILGKWGWKVVGWNNYQDGMFNSLDPVRFTVISYLLFSNTLLGWMYLSFCVILDLIVCLNGSDDGLALNRQQAISWNICCPKVK